MCVGAQLPSPCLINGYSYSSDPRGPLVHFTLLFYNIQVEVIYKEVKFTSLVVLKPGKSKVMTTATDEDLLVAS